LPQAKFPWAAVAVVSLVLATGAAVLWLKGGGESEPNEARSTSGAPPTSAGSASSASVTVQTSTAEVTAPAAVASSASTQAITAPASSNSSTTEQVAASANSTAATTSAAAVTPARPPPAAPSATEPTATGLDTTSGQILPPASAAGHRIFVDGKVASEGTDPIRVHCGSHMVRVGSAGDERKVDVPCGGSVKVGP
jgi:hypothetical protein